MFFWRASLSGRHGRFLDWGFTARGAGVSGPPYASLNLGGGVGDAPAAVQANRERVAYSFQVAPERLLFLEQCHGADVAVADEPWPGPAPRADAVLTTTSDLAVAALVADCVPVLIADPDAGVVAAVHCGRPGLAAGVVPRALEAMAAHGAGEVSAVVGPAVCGRCYEVPADMHDQVVAVSPAAAAVSWTGTPALDVAAGVVDQLRRGGVRVRRLQGCTREDPRLFSYRRERRTGRMAGVVVLRDTPACR